MANEPWEFKTDDVRPAETVNLFVIFCEDEVSEKLYFDSFASDKLRIDAKGNKRKGKLNLNATVLACLNAGYMEFTPVGYRLAITNMITDNLWCVYDRDLETTDLTQIRQDFNIEWNLAVQTATNAGLKVAWSNDAFELWILLHFEDITAAQAQHRDYIYERLTAIFKQLQPASAQLTAFTQHIHFNYKGAFKRQSAFEEFVLPEIKKRTNIAIGRATALAQAYQATTPYHDCNPCTLVHLLVKDLIANGGKI